jgi:hypothetical protein
MGTRRSAYIQHRAVMLGSASEQRLLIFETRYTFWPAIACCRIAPAVKLIKENGGSPRVPLANRAFFVSYCERPAGPG